MSRVVAPVILVVLLPLGGRASPEATARPVAGEAVARRAPAPAAPIRGVIEGFYGTPWSHETRLRMLPWLAEHGFNRFVYAPKDDPYLRDRWREPHPPAELSRLAALRRVGTESGIRLVYQVAPALDMCYSDRRDLDALTGKLAQVGSIGPIDVMLAFDDIPRTFHCAADESGYGPDGFGRAHADVANHVAAWLGREVPGSLLTVVPLDYFGQGSTPYRDALSSGLDPGVQIVWTGPATVSSTITAAQADAVARVYRRPPVLWDNYPVNDFDPDRLHLGPIAGRAPDLPGRLAGWLANPMPAAEASKIPLATIGAYLRDPAAYEPLAAWNRSLDELGGDRTGIATLRRLAENSQSTGTLDDPVPVWRPEATTLRQLMGEALPALATRGWSTSLDRLDHELSAESDLDLSATGNAPLVEQTQRWVEAVRLNGRAGRAAVSLLRATRPAFVTATVNETQGGYRVSGKIRLRDPARIKALRTRLDQRLAAVGKHEVHTHGSTIQYLAAVATAWASCPPSPLTVAVGDRSAVVSSSGRFVITTSARPGEIVASAGDGLVSARTLPPPSAGRGRWVWGAGGLAVVAGLLAGRFRWRRRGRVVLAALVVIGFPPMAPSRLAVEAPPPDVTTQAVATLAALARAVETGNRAALESLVSPAYRSGSAETPATWLDTFKDVRDARMELPVENVEAGPLGCGGPAVVLSRWTVTGVYQDHDVQLPGETVFSLKPEAGRWVVVASSTTSQPSLG
jgi:hypothetical protein